MITRGSYSKDFGANLTEDEHFPHLAVSRSHQAYQSVHEGGGAVWLLIYNIAGKAYFRHEEDEFTTNPGDVMLLAPHVPHRFGAYASQEPYVRFYTFFNQRPEWNDLLQWPEIAPGLMKLTISSKATRQNLRHIFNTMISYKLKHTQNRRLFAYNALEQVLLWCQTENPNTTSPRIDDRIARSLAYLSRNISKPITLTSLARRCGLSVSHFSFLFHQSTERTPQQYLDFLRMNQAKHLLTHTLQPIKEISLKVGYANPFYFSLRFKHYTGMNPRTFRQRVKVQA